MLMVRFFAVLLTLGLASCGVEKAVVTCTTNAECFEGYACDTSDSGICLPACNASGACRALQTCDTTLDVCRPRCESNDDCPTNYVCDTGVNFCRPV